jgi:phasin family protein
LPVLNGARQAIDAALHKKMLEMVRRDAYCALQHSIGEFFMATENNQAQAAADAPAKVADAVAETTKKVVRESKAAGTRERTATKRRAKRAATGTRTAKTSARKNAAGKTTRKYTRRATANTASTANAARETVSAMTDRNLFRGFDAIPAFAPFQSVFANAGERGQDAAQNVAQRGQKVAEQLSELTRANMEAMVEASRVAASGARTIGQDVVATSRDGVEQAADAIRTLAEAKSPTEYLQLQGNFARASFDRMVAQSSKLTETMVKLAGEAFQPLSNRASANAERFNNFVA